MQVALNTKISPELSEKLTRESYEKRKPKAQIIAEALEMYFEAGFLAQARKDIEEGRA